MIKFVTEIFVTVFFIGKIKIAPGTFGSLAAFPFVAFLAYLLGKTRYILPLKNYTLYESSIITFFGFVVIISLVLFFCGIYFSNKYMEHHQIHDPKEIVIDELVGQMLTIILCIFSSVFIYESRLYEKFNPNIVDLFVSFIMPFVLFRIFDIFKPWPINYLDTNIKGGLGVMLDDIVAAIFATIVHYALIFKIMNYYPK